MLSQVYNLPPPSPEIVAEYLKLDGTLPEDVMDRVIVPRTEEDAAQLVTTYLGEDHVGPANTHNNDPNAIFADTMAGHQYIPPRDPTATVHIFDPTSKLSVLVLKQS